MLKMKLEGTSSGNFLATGGFFECNTCHVMSLGCLKKKERKKKMKNSDFQPFQVGNLRTSFKYYHCYWIDWGSLYKLF